MNPYAYHYVSEEPPTPVPNKKPKNKKPLSQFSHLLLYRIYKFQDLSRGNKL